MTFLRSYAGFAGADVSLDVKGCENLAPVPPSPGGEAAPSEPALQGWWDQRVSTPFTVTWALGADGGAAMESGRIALPQACAHRLQGSVAGRPNEPPPYKLTVTLRSSPAAPANASRFKILRVASCGIAAHRDQACCR